MKKLFLLVLAIFICAPLFSQNYTITEVEHAPKLKKTCKENSSKKCFEHSILKFVNQNIDIVNLIDGGSGTAYVQFVINANGKVQDIRVRSNSKPLEKEAERIVKKLRFDEPAMKDGKAVAIKYTLPVRFEKKKFDSYDEFFESDLSTENISDLTEVATSPQIANCEATVECLKIYFQNDLAKKLQGLNFSKNEISELKFTFVITEDAAIENIIIAGRNGKIQNAARSILENTKIVTPALDENKKPVSVRLTYQLKNI